MGWGPRLRQKYSYYTPEEYYEALVMRLVTERVHWLDVGCGRDVFPSNRRLAELLADRCQTLVGIDPDSTILENPFVHVRVQSEIENYCSDRTFDVVTLRMVAEHIANPDQAVRSLAALTRPGGMLVIYTVNKWAPVSLASWLVPFRFHHPIKRLLWQTEEKDTFPVAYRMNTRGALKKLMHRNGFREVYFTYLDDLRTLARFRTLHRMELTLWRWVTTFQVNYPENCLLGVYQRP
jgi:SAM-dependent methyltransferase